LTSNALTATSPQPTPNDDVQQVLERSMLRLPYVKQSADSIASAGLFVQPFVVLRKIMRSVDDMKRTLDLGLPRRNQLTLAQVRRCAKANAKASYAVKAGPASKHRVNAKLTSGKAVRQKDRIYLARDEGSVSERQV
jgi:hypothetical protein